jgi:ribosomal RNA assembly protein
MKPIICSKFERVLKNRKKLEDALNVKIFCKNNEIEIDGEPENEFIAEKVIDALDLGFPFAKAMSIKEDKDLEIINIKEVTKKSDLARVRARIIGKGGKSFSTLNQLTKCDFAIKDNKVGIIGEPECIENAIESITSIAKGTKHSHVYAFLEKHPLEPIYDLGLKNSKKKTFK